MDISTQDLWDELYEQLDPDIPFDKAKTVRQVFEELNAKNPKAKVTENFVRKKLDRMERDHGWTKKKFRSTAYYWPPES